MLYFTYGGDVYGVQPGDDLHKRALLEGWPQVANYDGDPLPDGDDEQLEPIPTGDQPRTALDPSTLEEGTDVDAIARGVEIVEETPHGKVTDDPTIAEVETARLAGGEAAEAASDLPSGSIDELKEPIGGMSAEELDAFEKAEKEGGDRSGIHDLIASRRAALEAEDKQA